MFFILWKYLSNKNKQIIWCTYIYIPYSLIYTVVHVCTCTCLYIYVHVYPHVHGSIRTCTLYSLIKCTCIMQLVHSHGSIHVHVHVLCTLYNYIVWNLPFWLVSENSTVVCLHSPQRKGIFPEMIAEIKIQV